MKSAGIISFISFLFCLTLSAQTFVNENKMWSNTWIGTDFGWPYGVQYESYYIKFQGDTLINNLIYKNILRSDDENHTHWYWYGAIREDSTEKVYTYDTYGHFGEVLLYDFGVEEGDTIEANPWTTLIVNDINKIKLDNFEDSIRQIVFDYDYVWLEGIGSITNAVGGVLIGLPEIGMLGKYQDIVCYYENDTLKYSNAKFESCFPNHIVYSIKELDNEVPVVICSTNLITVSYNNIIPNESRFRVFSITGIKISDIHLNSSGKTVISTEKYPPGYYLYSINIGKHFFNGKIVIGYE
jgi:hypothetical protein